MCRSASANSLAFFSRRSLFVRSVAIAVLVTLFALQWAGVQVSSRFQQAATAMSFPRLPVIAAFAGAARRHCRRERARRFRRRHRRGAAGGRDHVRRLAERALFPEEDRDRREHPRER